MPASEQTRRRLSALTSHLGSVGCASAADAEFRVSPAPTSDVYFTNASSKKDIELPSSLRVKVSRLNPDLPPPPEPLPKDAPEVKANPWWVSTAQFNMDCN